MMKISDYTASEWLALSAEEKESAGEMSKIWLCQCFQSALETRQEARQGLNPAREEAEWETATKG